MNFSKNRMAEVFGVDRSTLFAWIRRGCPCIDATKPGGAAQLSFKDVLAWRKAYMAKHRWDEERIDKMESLARERLTVLKGKRARPARPLRNRV